MIYSRYLISRDDRERKKIGFWPCLKVKFLTFFFVRKQNELKWCHQITVATSITIQNIWIYASFLNYSSIPYRMISSWLICTQAAEKVNRIIIRIAPTGRTFFFFFFSTVSFIFILLLHWQLAIAICFVFSSFVLVPCNAYDLSNLIFFSIFLVLFSLVFIYLFFSFSHFLSIYLCMYVNRKK